MGEIRSPCIVELGARTGEDEQWLRDACSEDPKYVMVEPDMSNAQHILDDHPSRLLDQNRKLILGAINCFDGETVFWRSIGPNNSRTSGSLFEATPAHHERYPEIKFDGTTVVPCWTLDTIFRKEWLDKIDLLWMDIQGAEWFAILGGQEALKRTRYMFMEVETDQMYKTQLLRDQLLAVLPHYWDAEMTRPAWVMVEDFGDNVLLENKSYKVGRL